MPKAFERAAFYVRQKGVFTSEMMADAPVRALTEALYQTLQGAVESSIGQQEISQTMQHAIASDMFLFSGFKGFHEMKEASFLIKDEKGMIRSKKEFISEVALIDALYNKRYLSVEYDYAITSAAQAAQWLEYQQDGDRYDLQYRTMGDGRVRPDHAQLHGVTLPLSDPFWKEYYPPNGWACRCQVVQVSKGKYPASTSDEAIAKGVSATQGKGERFRFNPGLDKRVFPEVHSYNTSKCKNCNKLGEFNLKAKNKIKDSELCKACEVIREQVPDYEVIPTKRGIVRSSLRQGKSERKNNIDIATYFAEKYGYEIDLLPPSNKQATADSFNKTLGVEQEYKTNFTPTASAIDSALQKAKRQAEHVVIHIKSDISSGDLLDGMKDRLKRADHIKTVWIIKGGFDKQFNREDILSDQIKIQWD